MRCKRCLHKSHYILGDEAMKQEYKTLANNLTNLKAYAKTKYFAEKLDKNESTPRKT